MSFFLHHQLKIFVENMDKNNILLLMIILHISTRHLSAKLTYIFYLLQTLLCFAPIYGAGRKISKKVTCKEIGYESYRFWG